MLICLGAELFAKRRKRAEKWVVDETTVQKQAQEAAAAARASPAPPTQLPPPSVIDQNRVKHAQELNEIQVWPITDKNYHSK